MTIDTGSRGRVESHHTHDSATRTRLQRTGPASWVLAGTFLTVFAGVVPLSLLATGHAAADNNSAILVQLVVIGWASLRMTMIVRAGSPTPMAIGFWIYTYIFLGLAPLAQLVRNKFPGAAGVDSDALLTSSLIILLGIAAYDAARFFSDRRPNGPPRPTAQFSSARGKILAVVALAVAFAYSAWVGVDILFTSRFAVDDVVSARLDPATGALLVAAATVPVFVALHALIALRHQGRPAPIPLILLLVVANLVVTNFFSSPRYWFGTVLLSFALVLGRPPSLVRFRVLVIATLVGLLFVFPYADLFRVNRDATLQVSSLADQFVSSGDFDSYQQMTLGVAYTRADGLTFGRQLAGAGLFFVPRSVWPGKPKDTGVVLAEFAGYRFTNLSAPLWIEGYVNFGVLGVALFLSCFGLVSSLIDRRFRLSMLSRGPWFVAGSILAFYQVLVLRGSLLQSMARLTAIVVCLMLVSQSVGAWSRRRGT